MHIKAFTLCLSIIIISGCSGTHRYRVPKTKIVGAEAKAPLEAIEAILHSTEAPTIELYRCQPDSPERSKEKRPVATGVGGVFLPLRWELERISINSWVSDGAAISFLATLDSPVNFIEPYCGEVPGVIKVTESGAALVEIVRTYCNWAIIGNGLATIRLSLDTIDTRQSILSGYYSMSYYGTGNMNGSGCYWGTVGSDATPR